ncbi:type VI secretion system Vgr family protein [Acinetobacter vivianii]|uniref:type VI secretion system Vgr family protein n=1 Tax=Acinetobacter vivianii TaxID=1776742 RepID=UPI002DBA1E72|nr:type VI secretion system Vgr family protein [Acinetobacter vivianii]MEB6480695.1 type VI secretion system tip protein VgrG [Acinetobacter vivianii]MEB6658979.1 type VI secretion system tip protein VgrG [Acinetobacter vivianii]
MLSSIFQVLESLGLGTQKRAISIQFSNAALNTQIMLQRLDGYHGINDGLALELICLSTNPYIELKQFVGCQVAVDQVTDSGQLFRTTGIITGASQGQSDGALSLYRLTMQDATSLWHKRRNSRVFMNKSAVDICEIIFKEWQSKSPLFAASLKLDSSGLTKNYDIRPFSMQSNESDYEYLTRLLREESINFLIDESNYIVASSSQSIEAQKLRLIDDNAQFKALERRSIRYHRSNAVEQADSITSLIAQRQLQPTAIHVQRWQADSLSQEDASGSVLSSHQHSTQRDNESLSLEQAWNISPAWIADLNGEDQATASGNNQLEKLNKQLNQYQALQAKYFTAHSSVRDTQVGYWFQLNDHPELEKNHSQNDKEFLILTKRFYNQNNLPKDIKEQVEKLLSLSHWPISKDSEHERQANELMVVRRTIAIVPEYDPLTHRPTAHVQRAKVVSDGEEIHVDEWGRIKVRFLFTRTEDHAHDGGAGSNDSDTDSAWVDVLTPWAGEGYGARFLPRKDELVVIDFFDGNIDRPFVTGRIHEAQRSPTKFDIKGQLPHTKKLSGIRSKEVGGEGYNQLRFDDTTGQISAQLHSSHAASQLNLGQLSHPKEQAESKDRGQGFELRSDAAGAIRSKGLYLSTFVQDQAQNTQLEAKEALAQFSESFESMKALSEYAEKQQAEAADMLAQVETYIKKVETQWSDLKAARDALILMASPESIATVSGKDIHLHAKESITVAGGQSVNVSTDENLILNAKKKVSVFAGQEDFKIYAAKGKLDLQVQDNTLEAAARLDIKITSSEGKVEIQSPTEIVLKAKDSALKINAEGVTVVTPNTFKAKAGQHIFTTGASETPQLPIFPNNICWECLARRASQRGAFINKGEGV